MENDIPFLSHQPLLVIHDFNIFRGITSFNQHKVSHQGLYAGNSVLAASICWMRDQFQYYIYFQHYWYKMLHLSWSKSGFYHHYNCVITDSYVLSETKPGHHLISPGKSFHHITVLRSLTMFMLLIVLSNVTCSCKTEQVGATSV